MMGEIQSAINNLKAFDYLWDVDEGMDDEYKLSHPLYRLIELIHLFDESVLRFLLFHVSVRTLPCWEVICAYKRPRDTIKLIAVFLKGQSDKRTLGTLLDYSLPTEPCIDDSRYREVSATSNAIANAALYMTTSASYVATYSVSSAKLAFEHVFINDEFEKWFFEFAIPVSFEKRFMKFDEINKLAVNEHTISAYKNIYNDICLP
jgi:hypothetical protein